MMPAAVASHEYAADRANAAAPYLGAPLVVCDEFTDGAAESDLVVAVDEDAGLAVDHGVGVTRNAGDDSRRPARRRLGDRHAPTFAGRRARYQPGPAVQVDEVGVGDVARERHPVGAVDISNDLVEVLALVADADDRQRELRVPAPRFGDGANEVVVPLHGHEPAERHDHGRRASARRRG